MCSQSLIRNIFFVALGVTVLTGCGADQTASDPPESLETQGNADVSRLEQIRWAYGEEGVVLLDARISSSGYIALYRPNTDGDGNRLDYERIDLKASDECLNVIIDLTRSNGMHSLKPSYAGQLRDAFSLQLRVQRAPKDSATGDSTYQSVRIESTQAPQVVRELSEVILRCVLADYVEIALRERILSQL